MDINFVLGYVEKNCSVRCLTFLKDYIKAFKIMTFADCKEVTFESIDSKASKEFFNFVSSNLEKLR